MSGVLWAAAALAGGVGALGRFGLDSAISARRRGDFPLGTFVVNVSGSLLLGLLAGLALRGDALVVGGSATIGSYTTFSTWMFESHRLAEAGQGRLAAANALVSLAAGLLAVFLGRLLGGAL